MNSETPQVPVAQITSHMAPNSPSRLHRGLFIQSLLVTTPTLHRAAGEDHAVNHRLLVGPRVPGLLETTGQCRVHVKGSGEEWVQDRGAQPGWHSRLCFRPSHQRRRRRQSMNLEHVSCDYFLLLSVPSSLHLPANFPTPSLRLRHGVRAPALTCGLSFFPPQRLCCPVVVGAIDSVGRGGGGEFGAEPGSKVVTVLRRLFVKGAGWSWERGREDGRQATQAARLPPHHPAAPVQRFSVGVALAPRGTSGSVWRHFCHNQGGATGIGWAEAGGATPHPTTQNERALRGPPTTWVPDTLGKRTKAPSPLP
ncbi:uncharacterized protein LOC113593348 [Acinonyx jubatus]|uniref:Uncharacterized protein LOC113593348 n=1 Tax=Acinonyx jubatus TaxID=32536 RepID=A0ABM3P4Q7_ACIJB|nr:uncharacterized protein LOC113593348 [Acinonyx jubatus]XP_053066654.1 uncharacterized protein LOC113593348 [Acinonyx jubatus]XP_053066655.1 uncharacterized protein LOC113593348 [Acinonyx jubatus]